MASPAQFQMCVLAVVAVAIVLTIPKKEFRTGKRSPVEYFRDAFVLAGAVFKLFGLYSGALV